MRGELCDILFNAANAFSNVKFIFNTSISSIQQTEHSVSITTSDGKQETYDILIAADGFRSKTRALILENNNTEAFIQSQNCWVAYFSIPRQAQDHPRSRGYNAVGGRFIMIRPKDNKVSSGYLVLSKDSPSLRKVQREGMEAQKAALAEIFADAGWEATRVIEGMKDTEDFYLQDVAKIELGGGGWSRGRCAMVGDAAYCSFTGTGTRGCVQSLRGQVGWICQEGAECTERRPAAVCSADKVGCLDDPNGDLACILEWHHSLDWRVQDAQV
jgi:2-polyprenyl-6-methoxyphenol hydroxylase-like FAD-dependent oxidoreductase